MKHMPCVADHKKKVIYYTLLKQKPMEMARSKRRKESEDEKKREEVDWFALLPDDILLRIFKRVDSFLRYKAKYVCRRWFNLMIRNRTLLDRASFIIQKSGIFTARFVDVGEEGQGQQVKVQSLDIPCEGLIRSWCNEFLLISVCGRPSLYVYNLITKEVSYLPECNAPCGGYHDSICGVTLSFDEIKRIYKVLHMFIGPTIQCHILMLGKDAISPVTSKWKKIQVPNMIQGSVHRCTEPISVQTRYFHWEIVLSHHLVSVDMVKEEMLQISLPDVKHVRSFFVMGGFLAVALGVSRHKTEIWVLKDFHRVKWEKLQSVSLKNRYFERYPGTSFVYRVFGIISKRYVILACRVHNGMFSYDLKNGVVKWLDIHIDYKDERWVLHSSASSFI